MVSRRMQKQGPPPPLDESRLTKKRKADEGAANASEQGKRKKRKEDGLSRKSNGKKELPVRDVSSSKSSKGKIDGGVVKKKGLLKTPPNGDSKTKIKIKKQIKMKSMPVQVDSNGKSSPAAHLESSEDLENPDMSNDRPDAPATEKLDALDFSDDDEVGDLEDEISEDQSGASSADVVDSEEENMGMWSDDSEDEDETLNAANMEGMSKRLDAKAAQEAADAQAELEEAAMQTNIAGDHIPGLDDASDDEAGLKTRLAPDLQLLRRRIADTIQILDNFAKAKRDRSRAEYVRQLLKDISAYYGYSYYLAEKLFNLFSPREAHAFFEANETPRPVVIRTNTLRTNRRRLAEALINRGVTLEPVGKWSKVGLQIFETNVPLGATPEYLAGQYIMQAASSFLPVMALAPQEDERILDMASAPGGKTTYISALMKNTGVLFANDSNKSRSKALVGNTHRLGVKNTIICNYDALQFPRVMGGFDRVLLDAPCSGTGVIAKDSTVKTSKTEHDFIRLPEMQKKLLLAAIDSVDHASKTGGFIVYSTCSVTVEENEAVVNYALSRRPNVKLVDTGLTFGREGFTKFMGKIFHHTLNLTRRYYPHAYNVDGFFVSKFRKTGPTPAGASGATGPVINGSMTSAPSVANKDNVPAEQVPVEGSSKTLVPDGLPLINGTSGLSHGDQSEDSFGGFDSEEDAEFIERARRSGMRRKGLNPKADRSKAKDPDATKSKKEKSKNNEKEKKERDRKGKKDKGKEKRSKKEKVLNRNDETEKSVKDNADIAVSAGTDIAAKKQVRSGVDINPKINGDSAGPEKDSPKDKPAAAAGESEVSPATKTRISNNDPGRPRVSDATKRMIMNSIGFKSPRSRANADPNT
ncbi:MAG: rRNA (cytosine-C5-)-methyltransferase nop2 [Alyxoria varia]|nr:MAG: rRNA (cytosine-C5-)-methyltransferase nop2 [Alyxoria varia]